MSSCPFTTLIAALLTPVIAIIAGYIAYRQWRTAQDKLKLELFEKRFSIYKAALSLIYSVLFKDITGEACERFRVGTREAKWLLSSDIHTYFDNMYDRATELQMLQQRNNKDRQFAIVAWFREQPDIIDEKFASYLMFKH